MTDVGVTRPTLCCDFDGVINTYTTPFTDIASIPDPPVDGAIAWLYQVAREFNLVVFSVRGATMAGQTAIMNWLTLHGFTGVPYAVTDRKPAAVMYLDDRGWRFTGPGSFPTVADIRAFHGWNAPPHDPPEPPEASAGAYAARLAAGARFAEQYLTVATRAAVEAAGGHLAGVEHRLKTERHLAGKIEAVMAQKQSPLPVAAGDVKDAVRYTAVFDPALYSAGVAATLTGLAAAGFTVDRLRNYWDASADASGRDTAGTYVGVNAVVGTRDGYRYELQFHTPDSLVDQELNWDTYRRLRNGDLASTDRAAAVGRMRASASQVPRPPGVQRLRVNAPVTAAGPPAPSAAALTAALLRGRQRADALEPKLVSVLERLLARAGDEAAAAFRAKATDHLTAAAWRLAAGSPVAVQANSTMVCVMPTVEQQQALADADGNEAATLHVTLAYLVEVDGPLTAVRDALAPVAASYGPLTGVVGGAGRFDPPGVQILLPDVPGLVELRVAVTQALLNAGIAYSRDHGFLAHVSVGAPDDTAGPDPRSGLPLDFADLLIVRGNAEVERLPLVGPTPLTAAGDDDQTPPPPWGKPAADEVLDVAALTASLRSTVGPVMETLIRNVAGEALGIVGISFDVTNPLFARVVGSVGTQITHVAKTTQNDVRAAIDDAYAKGLSIPDTADAIRASMKAASNTRAVLIARTELVGAVNGASAAATSIVAEVTGTDYEKTWMTAPGAQFPRHETYSDLDGQTVALNDPFDVGGEALMFPGDPAGDPSETANCRCAMAYIDVAGGETETEADDGG